MEGRLMATDPPAVCFPCLSPGLVTPNEKHTRAEAPFKGADSNENKYEVYWRDSPG